MARRRASATGSSLQPPATSLPPVACSPAVSPPLSTDDHDSRVDLSRCPAGPTGAEEAVGASDLVALLDQAASTLATLLPVLAWHSSRMDSLRWAGSAAGTKACPHRAAGRPLWSGLIDAMRSLAISPRMDRRRGRLCTQAGNLLSLWGPERLRASLALFGAVRFLPRIQYGVFPA